MNYLGIDIGGSKTLIAVFDSSGQIIAEKKFPTAQDYDSFLLDLEKNVETLSTNTIVACSVAVPGLISRDSGIAHAMGNLGWQEKSIKGDIAKVLNNIPVVIENDSRVAGLAEADALSGEYKKVFYVTVSTGIGGALIEQGQIVKSLEDIEIGQIPLQYEGKVQKWEDFASGRAIYTRYGKPASEIEDEQAWKEIGERIGYGLAICCSILQPEVVVFGGGAGQFADKFKSAVNDYLVANLSPLIRRPKDLLGPTHADRSTIYGCFILLKQHGLIK